MKRHHLQFIKKEDLAMFKLLERHLKELNKKEGKTVHHKTPYMLAAIREKMIGEGIL